MTRTNQHPPHEQELIDYVCGELDEPRRTAVERTLEHDAEARQEVARLQAALSALHDAEARALPEDFTTQLQHRIEAEALEPASRQHAGGARLRPTLLRLGVPLSALAAAIVLIAVLLGLPALHPGGARSIAWADVVEAMGRIEYFHVTAFSDDPRSADEDQRLFRMELYYRAPDRWRGEGLGHVQFLRGEESRIYDAQQRRFVDAQDARVQPIPEAFVRRFRRDDLLTATLGMMFWGEVPEGEPVKSDAVASAAGIEVFDYARDSSDQWARIWVLKESRLPLQIKIFRPRSNSFMLVSFDYSAPKPARYFDADHFERVIEQQRLREPYQILRAGAEPIAGRPTNRGHVHQMQGEYQAPQILETASNAEGGIMIVHTDTRNVPPEGGSIRQERYATPLTDNWGNVYYPTGGSRPVGGDWQRYYMPAQPFRRGEGERRITMKYTMELTAPGAEAPHAANVTLHQVLRTDQVPIPLEDDGWVPAQAKADHWGAEAQQQVQMQHMKATAPALDQWRYVQQQLERAPDDLHLLDWAHRLLELHDRHVPAQALMAERIVPLFLEDPIEH